MRQHPPAVRRVTVRRATEQAPKASANSRALVEVAIVSGSETPFALVASSWISAPASGVSMTATPCRTPPLTAPRLTLARCGPAVDANGDFGVGRIVAEHERNLPAPVCPLDRVDGCALQHRRKDLRHVGGLVHRLSGSDASKRIVDVGRAIESLSKARDGVEIGDRRVGTVHGPTDESVGARAGVEIARRGPGYPARIAGGDQRQDRRAVFASPPAQTAIGHPGDDEAVIGCDDDGPRLDGEPRAPADPPVCTDPHQVPAGREHGVVGLGEGGERPRDFTRFERDPGAGDDRLDDVLPGVPAKDPRRGAGRLHSRVGRA